MDHDVLEQGELNQDPDFKLIINLLRDIRDCHCFIALVGDLYGSAPESQPGAVPRSYTQWEYYFARGVPFNGIKTKRKPILICFATTQLLRQIVEEDDESPKQPKLREILAGEVRSGAGALQEKFKSDLSTEGNRFYDFESIDNLVRNVLLALYPVSLKRCKRTIGIALCISFTLGLALLPMVDLFSKAFVVTPEDRPPFAAVPGGALLELIYSSNAPAGVTGAPAPEIQCDLFEADKRNKTFVELRNGTPLTSSKDAFFIGLHSLTPGWLYVFTIGSQGGVTCFLGLGGETYSEVKNPVFANQSLAIPSRAWDSFKLDNVIGAEHYYVVFCQARWLELEKVLAKEELAGPSPLAKDWKQPFRYLNRGSNAAESGTNGVVKKFLFNNWIESAITSSPVLATNGCVVIERVLRHEDEQR
jgi:hypothetical protein